jgi:hypothetical protein
MRKVRNSSACTNVGRYALQASRDQVVYISTPATHGFDPESIIKLLMKDDIEDVLLGC